MDELKISIETSKYVHPNCDNKTKVYIYPNTIELSTQHNQTHSCISNYVRMDKHHILNKTTGEAIEVKHHSSRLDNYKYLQQSYTELRRRTNYNFTGEPSEKQAVLTYASPDITYHDVPLDYG